MHLYHCWKYADGIDKWITFYVPKLESELEAQYVWKVVSVAEKKLKELFGDAYPLPLLQVNGDSDSLTSIVKLFIVFENPR